jgi:hypothetical protein
MKHESDDSADTDEGHVGVPAPEGKAQAIAQARLTDRDRDILGLLAVARYLSTSQLRALSFDGKSAQAAHHRLTLLARGQAPFVRQQFFRTYDGRRLCAWAPTSNALPAALQRTSQVRELPKHDVGARHLEHALQLNELFVALWRSPGRPARARHPSFRWTPSDAVRLVYGAWAVEHGREVGRVIIPDAVLELPTVGRRLFLECEMGTNTIVPESPDKPGATLNKVARYQKFIRGVLTEDDAHYPKQYPDGFAPEVLFLVLTKGRANSVNAALAAWRESLQSQRPVAVRALTFDVAAVELRQLAGLPALRVQEPERRSGKEPTKNSSRGQSSAATLTREEVNLVWRYVYDAHATIQGARAEFRKLGRQQLPPYPATSDQVVDLLKRLANGS